MIICDLSGFIDYYGVIYKITNIVNDKIYIGQTKNIKSRIKDYKYYNTKRKHYKYHIIEEIEKFGIDNFRLDIIDTCNNQEELYQKEIYWISKLDSTNPKIGYNKKSGGLGGKLNPETRERMSISSRKFRHTEDEKLRRSKEVYIYDGKNSKAFDSVKNCAEFLNVERTHVTRAIKKGLILKGYFIYYLDCIQRETIIKNIQLNIDSGVYKKSIDLENKRRFICLSKMILVL